MFNMANISFNAIHENKVRENFQIYSSLCKQFKPRSNLTSDIIWIQTVWHSHVIPERSFFENVNFGDE